VCWYLCDVHLASKVPAMEMSGSQLRHSVCDTVPKRKISSLIMTTALEDPPALFTAAEGGRVQDVRQLLLGGANIEERGRNGVYSPLHVAVFMGRTEVVQILLEHGADVLAKTHGGGGDSPLHLVFSLPRMAGREAIIRSLLRKGADASAKNSTGRTPLHHAVFQDSVEALKLLLDHGADISTTECGGNNVLHWAVEKHNVESVQERNRKIRNPLLPANRREIEKAEKVIQMLLAHGTDVSAKIANLRATTDAGKTPKQVAYTEDITEMLRSALLRAEGARRGLLEAFTLGHHARLGAASRILPLSTEMVQMIMDRV
jgi:ankyrin repeat protein